MEPAAEEAAAPQNHAVNDAPELDADWQQASDGESQELVDKMVHLLQGLHPQLAPRVVKGLRPHKLLTERIFKSCLLSKAPDLAASKAMRLMEKSGQASDPSAEFVLTTMFHEMGQEYASLGAQLARRDSELTGPGTEPITITIYNPHETPSFYGKTFKNAHKFERWMARANIADVFKDGEHPGIDEFSDLVPGALYTIGVCSIPARVKKLEQHKEHLVRWRERELACATKDDLASEGVKAVELGAQRVAKGAQGDEAEVDVAIRSVCEPGAVGTVCFADAPGCVGASRFAGESGFVVGSMKSHINGDSDVRKSEKKIQQHYTQRVPFAGSTIQPAFMAETVKPGHLDRLKATCAERGVRLYARNGRSISRVQLQAAASVQLARI